MHKPQVGIASVWYEGNTCNMHLERPGRARSRKGCTAAGTGRHAVQHHRRQRRHLDGHRGHVLLAAVARPDRRLDRDRDARPVVRRQHLDSRLRQEHARLPDRDGPAQSPVADGLWRHDQAGPLHARRQRREARHRLGLPVLRRIPGRHDRREDRAAKSSRKACPGAGACGGMYTANTMASAIEAMGMSLPYSSSIPADDPAKLDECFRGRRGDSHLPGTRHQAARHHDPRARSRTRWSS